MIDTAVGYLDRGKEAQELLARFDDTVSAYVRDRIWFIPLEGL